MHLALRLLKFPLLGLLLTSIAPGSLGYECQNNHDCSLNGVCNNLSGACKCDPGWRDFDCGVLDTLPSVKGTGYNHTAEGISSWGSRMVQDPVDSKKFYLFAAEFVDHCGLNYWAPYSRTIRALSHSGPLGPYNFDMEVAPTFSHNPTVIWSPADKLWILYMIGCPIQVPSDNGDCQSISFLCDDPGAGNGESGIFAYSSPDLTDWTYFGKILGYEDDIWANATDHDVTNPSAFPFWSPHDRTPAMMLAYRYNMNHMAGNEFITFATAPRWNETYTRTVPNPLVPNWAEDPCVWRDKRGNWHMLVHSIGAADGYGSGPPVGRHMYTHDIYGKWTWGNRTVAYNTTVFFTDGTNITYGRRERPQLKFSEDGEMTPLFFTQAVQEQGDEDSYSVVSPIGKASKKYMMELGFKYPPPI